MKKFLLLFTLVSTLGFLTVKPANADSNCQSIYGGGIGCGNGTITVEKQILKPGTTDQYVDNLSLQDAHFSPLSPIFFKIIIKNISNTTLTNIVVQDTIDNTRQFIEFSDGPGHFDNVSKTLTYSLGSLNPGQSDTEIVKARVNLPQNLPANQQTICPVNTVQASVTSSQPTSATTQYCIDTTAQAVTISPTQTITKGGLIIQTPTVTPKKIATQTNNNSNQSNNFPIYTPSTKTKNTPKTGPEELPLLAMIPTGAIGIWLRRKAG